MDNNTELKSNVVIAGAGPAGITTSLFLSKFKIPHIIVEKDNYPKDKICGGAISGKGLSIMNRWDNCLIQELNKYPDLYLPLIGSRFSSPDNSMIEIELVKSKIPNSASGYVVRRKDFDSMLFNHIDRDYATVLTNTKIKEIKRLDNDTLELLTKNEEGVQKINCRMVVAADGDSSIVSRTLAGYKKSKEEYCVAARAYFKNVKGFHANNYIELHFINDLIPGYLWIFPLTNNEANVGLGTLSKDIRKKNLKLDKILWDNIKNNPLFKDRFTEAELIGKFETYGIPIASKQHSLVGNNYLLTGDAAYLVDPVTGEGIGPAMITGMFAAEQIKVAIEKNSFTKETFQEYEDKVYKKMWEEIKLSKIMFRIIKIKWLFNFIIRKISQKKYLQELLAIMYYDVEKRKKIKNPINFIKLLFRK